MKTLLILRHAKSSWKQEGLADHERPLNERGKRAAPRMARLIQEQDLVPDLILSSTAVRARATAEIVADGCDFAGELRLEPRLYLGDPEDYLYLLRSLPPTVERVMVVGHNPGLEHLLARLTDEDEVLPTAALAVVRLPIHAWSELDRMEQGTLLHLWRPREL